jgi:hypothetical protein
MLEYFPVIASRQVLWAAPASMNHTLYCAIGRGHYCNGDYNKLVNCWWTTTRIKTKTL